MTRPTAAKTAKESDGATGKRKQQDNETERTVRGYIRYDFSNEPYRDPQSMTGATRRTNKKQTPPQSSASLKKEQSSSVSTTGTAPTTTVSDAAISVALHAKHPYLMAAAVRAAEHSEARSAARLASQPPRMRLATMLEQQQQNEDEDNSDVEDTSKTKDDEDDDDDIGPVVTKEDGDDDNDAVNEADLEQSLELAFQKQPQSSARRPSASSTSISSTSRLAPSAAARNTDEQMGSI